MDNIENKLRLQKFLADSGIASRRKSEELIRAGRVSVNGAIVTQLGTKINPETDRISLDAKLIQSKTQMIYIMLHKPEAVISSVSDPQKRPVVLDFVQNIPARLFPVGRLDYDSSGLILLTNDGKLSQALSHPRHSIPKTYIVKLKNMPSEAGLRAFREGLIIDEGAKTAPAKIKLFDKKPLSGGAKCSAEISIYEGRNRQIRKMCEAIGCPVLQLKRISIGPLKLGNLPRGKYRNLSQGELNQLLEITKKLYS